MQDFETASYFYNRELEIAREAKSISGQAKALTGLGFCEEQVHNIQQAMKYHEMALERAIDGNLSSVIREISIHLVRVYKNIAKEC